LSENIDSGGRQSPHAQRPELKRDSAIMSHLERFYRRLEAPIAIWARVVLLFLTLLVVLSYAVPLWRVSMFAPQYPNGLYVDIYSYKVVGGNSGHDVQEINELNHYIGMNKIDRANLSDLDWIPFAVGALILLALRVAAIGDRRSLLDLAVLTGYVMFFALGRYVYRLYIFGHDLNPHAAINIQPFMPVVIGTRQVANFTVSSYPRLGGLLMFIFTAGVAALALWQLFHAPPEQDAARDNDQPENPASAKI
jgi:copper chaperone NosL